MGRKREGGEQVGGEEGRGKRRGGGGRAEVMIGKVAAYPLQSAVYPTLTTTTRTPDLGLPRVPLASCSLLP